jgi:NAD(P)-dependent dehydrogenase (short-subunit alcohol dehydrogenase family)
MTHTNMANKTAIVTGGSSGIGLSLANECVKKGASVILLARKEGPLRQARDELQALAQQGQRHRGVIEAGSGRGDHVATGSSPRSGPRATKAAAIPRPAAT